MAWIKCKEPKERERESPNGGKGGERERKREKGEKWGEGEEKCTFKQSSVSNMGFERNINKNATYQGTNSIFLGYTLLSFLRFLATRRYNID